MTKLLFLFATVFTVAFCSAQYKNDNVLYKTVYTQDLCKEMQKQTGYLLLDVRSKGEYEDTSSAGLNIGRFKDAKHINVSDLGLHIGELAAYKDKPVFVYCSHSQRSRRASKMLADSGFTNVININGGMTNILQLPAGDHACVLSQLTTKNNYSFISPKDFCSKLSKGSQQFFVIDVRDDSAYQHISKDAKVNAYGTFRSAKHISLAELQEGKANIPKDREIVIIDNFGGQQAAKAGELLAKNNYPKLSVLIQGIDRLLFSNNNDLPCMAKEYVSPVKYNLLSPQQLKTVVETKKDLIFLDVRSKEEFTNKHKNYWQNIGHLVDAINIPTADLENQIADIEKYKASPLVLYAFGSSTTVYEAANILSAKGFTNVNVLQGGLFNVGWTAANIKGFSSLASLRVDVPVENQ